MEIMMSKAPARFSHKKSVAYSCKKTARDELPIYGQGYNHLMDIKPHLEEASQEEAREKLIAIAYSSPEETVAADGSTGTNRSDVVPATNKEEAEKYRSELISISYIQSPDMKASPLPNGIYHG